MSSRTFRLPDEPFDAVVTVPGDKSLGHSALILGAIADGASCVVGTSDGEDIAATRRVTAALGVAHSDGAVESPGRESWTSPATPLDCGNSGTTMRLLTGALAGGPVGATLVGDDSLTRRPMERLVGPLRQLGAEVAVGPGGTAPIRVTGRELTGSTVVLPIASAQVRTAVAFAALSASGPTTIDSPPGFRDHTERWFAELGLGEYETDTRFRVDPGAVPPLDVTIPADPSSAAFLWAAAAVRPGARVTTRHVSANPGRLGFLEILHLMGAAVEVEPVGTVLGDPVADITVRGGDLNGVDVAGPLAVRALDELPLVAVVAAAASGPTVVSDAGELRAKESDRIASGVALAALAGAEGEELEDGFIVTPVSGTPGGAIDSAGDHRVAMAAAIAAIAGTTEVTIERFESAAVSWPGFAAALEALWS